MKRLISLVDRSEHEAFDVLYTKNAKKLAGSRNHLTHFRVVGRQHAHIFDPYQSRA
jgi:hypothetical protein